MANRQLRLPRIPALAIVAIVLLASAVLAARAPAVVTWLDVGSPGDEAYTSFAFPPESNGVDTFRWTSGRASLRVPVERDGRYRLDLRAATVNPAGRTLRITCGDRVHEIPLTLVGADSTVPLECRAAGDDVELAIEVPVVYLPNGGRALGVAFSDIRVTALDDDDRLAFRGMAGLTIFSSLAGVGLGLAALRREKRWPWVAGTIALLLGWLWLVEREPDLVLSAVSGPGGILALTGGMTAWLLACGRDGRALALGALAVTVVLSLPQPAALLVLESAWTKIEIDALRALPGLAAIAVLAAATLGGRRGRWLAAAGTGIAIASLFMPIVSSWAVARWSHQIQGPDWIDRGSFAGAFFILAVFILTGLAAFAAMASRRRMLLRVALVAAAGIVGLLLWRVEVMRLNGDEPHYYVTARSIGVDGDLDILNNHLEPAYVRSTNSPIGNVTATRDAEVFRYSGTVPATDDSWFLVPSLEQGWTIDGGTAGLTRAGDLAPILHGPDGALAIPPPLAPATRHAFLVETPCKVNALAVGVLGDADQVEVRLAVLNPDGGSRWEGRGTVDAPFGMIDIPADSGLCHGSGWWTISIDAGDQPVVAEALDHYKGLEFIGGRLQDSWLFAGLPRDRYGSVGTRTRLLLHNPSDKIALLTVRLMTASDLTTSEITIGLQPGQTVVEPLPIFGAEAVAVIVTDPVEIGAALYGIVASNRYRMPATQSAGQFEMTVPANPNRDAGLWLTLANPTSEPVTAALHDGGQNDDIEICPGCAVTRHIEAGDENRVVSVNGVDGDLIAPAAIAYEERTGRLHFDLGLPLLAAPLARFDSYWPVLIVTALAGIALAPGLFLLMRDAGLSQQPAALAAMLAVMLAPLSTYAVRFYTDGVAAALMVWAIVLWERGWRSNTALASMAAVAVALPLLHGRLTVLAGGVLAFALFAAIQANRDILRRYRPRVVIPAAVAGLLIIGLLGLVALQPYAIALNSRGIGNFFGREWILPNAFGMLIDRGTGVLPFAPWVIFALAVPRPLHRTQRAALLLVLLYYALLMLRSGGWQTWGSPMRYLLPVIPLLATLALPGMVRLWRSNRTLSRVIVGLVMAWSLAVTMLLHWRPLSGYVERPPLGNDYLIDQALTWLPFRSPFEFMPTIEAQPGPSWGEPFGMAILVILAAAGAWLAWGLVRECGVGSRE